MHSTSRIQSFSGTRVRSRLAYSRSPIVAVFAHSSPSARSSTRAIVRSRPAEGNPRWFGRRTRFRGGVPAFQLPRRKTGYVDRVFDRAIVADEFEIESQVTDHRVADRAAVVSPRPSPHVLRALIRNPAAPDRLAGEQAQVLVTHPVDLRADAGAFSSRSRSTSTARSRIARRDRNGIEIGRAVRESAARQRQRVLELEIAL